MFSRAFVPGDRVKHASGEDPGAEIEVQAAESRRAAKKGCGISADFVFSCGF